MRILFMGTPEIAVSSLNALIKDGQDIIGVVTAPDKPAGRGRQVRSPAVKQLALQKGLNVLQPEKLKDPPFLGELKSLDPGLIVVVAFRLLPEEVWGLPPRGTINLHASLLPNYRGAAPIHRVIMNGETHTGVSTFFIEKDIDTGKIIMQESLPIGPDEDAGSLHDRIAEAGAKLLVKTVRSIQKGNPPQINQSELIKPGEVLKTAPKISKEDCQINWRKSVRMIYDQIRGLSPFPGAWTKIVSPEGVEKIIKVYRAEKLERGSVFPACTLVTDGKSRFEVVCRNGLLNIKELQLEGKTKMSVEDFLRGIPDISNYRIA